MVLSCTDEYKAIPGNRPGNLPKLVTSGPVDLVTTVVLGVTRLPMGNSSMRRDRSGLLDQWE